MPVTFKGDSGRAFKRRLRLLEQNPVLVGFPAGEGAREEGGPLTNAAIAYIQDKGAPEANIPARPFMAPGIEAAKEGIAKGMRTAFAGAALGDRDRIRSGQMAVGMAAAASIKNLIADGISPPLAPATLAARKRKGFQGETPLQVTGQLRNAVQYVLPEPGE